MVISLWPPRQHFGPTHGDTILRDLDPFSRADPVAAILQCEPGWSLENSHGEITSWTLDRLYTVDGRNFASLSWGLLGVRRDHMLLCDFVNSYLAGF